MVDFIESESFLLPSEVRNDVAGRLKEPQGIRSLQLHLKGESLENTKEFSRMLVALSRQGAKVSHEISIQLDFSRPITRERVLSLVGNMPKPRNGSLKVRLQLEDKPDGDGEAGA